MGYALSARQILGGQVSSAAGDCCVCGGSLPGQPIGKIVSDNFTTWDLVRGDKAAACCTACEALFREFRFRNTALVCREGVSPEKMDAAVFRAVLADPPDRYAMTWPASRKKHCWLHAGISTRETLAIGCDDGTVVIGVDQARTAAALVDTLFAAGATKAEVKIGIYRPVVVQRLGAMIDAAEVALQPHRASGALDIIVWSCDREAGAGSGDIIMLDDKDRLAAELLARLANGSVARDTDAIGFWGRGYLSRVTRRTGSPSLKRFVEMVAADVAVRTVALRETVVWIEGRTEADQAAMLDAIRASPRVMVAMAQDAAKRLRPSASSTPRLPVTGGDALNDLLEA